MTLMGHYVLRFKTNACAMVLLLSYSFRFNLLLYSEWVRDVQPHVSKAGAITALAYRILNQITIEENWLQKNHATSHGFLAIARLLSESWQSFKILFVSSSTGRVTYRFGMKHSLLSANNRLRCSCIWEMVEK